MALAACGSSGGSKSSGTSATSGSKTSTSSDTKAASGGGSTSDFCAEAKSQVDELPQKMQSVLTSGDANAWLAYADAQQQSNEKLVSMAPAAIKADVQTVEQASDAIISGIRDAKGNVAQIRASIARVSSITGKPEFAAASARWGAYLTKTCGISMPTG